jgi:hypothetical protein
LRYAVYTDFVTIPVYGVNIKGIIVLPIPVPERKPFSISIMPEVVE